jgi:hypothetical protein
LRDSLRALQQQHRLAIFLDRRVDPSQVLDLDLRDVTLRQALEVIAARKQLGLAWVGSVAYFGPQETGRYLRTLAELRRQDVDKLPAAARKKLRQPSVLTWDHLAIPRDILRGVADQYGVAIENLQRVPHDLWPAGVLSPMTACDQLTLLLVGFGLTFQIDETGNRLQLVPIPKAVTLDRLYAAEGQDPVELAKLWKRVAQDSQIKVYNGQVAVRGRIEDHERIEALRRGEPVRIEQAAGSNGPVPRETVKLRTYTLKVSAPLDQLLSALAEQARFQLELDRESLSRANIDMKQIVEVDVKEVTLDQLLEASLKPAGLQHRRDGMTVSVTPLR